MHNSLTRSLTLVLTGVFVCAMGAPVADAAGTAKVAPFPHKRVIMLVKRKNAKALYRMGNQSLRRGKQSPDHLARAAFLLGLAGDLGYPVDQEKVQGFLRENTSDEARVAVVTLMGDFAKQARLAAGRQKVSVR